MKTDYEKYRGKCKEFCLAAIEKEPTLQLIRGYYHCPFWGKQEHWWTTKPDGTVFDPTVKQFPTKGIAAEYEVFDGTIVCEECGREFQEGKEGSVIMGSFATCSNSCAMRLVGL